MDANISALKSSKPGYEYLQRYTEIAKLLTGNLDATEEDGVNWVLNLVNELEIPPLRSYGFSPSSFSTLIPKSLASSSMKGNPFILSDREIENILQNAY